VAIYCLKNFICNQVKGFPGKTLSAQEAEQVKPFLPQLVQEGLAQGEPDSAEGVFGSPAAAQAGEEVGAAESPAIVEPQPQEEKKPKGKRKQKG
jgi:hypothetical protein